jgi:hypothetical protein
MDILAGLAIILVYLSPFLVAGLVVFICLAFITFMLAKLSPANSNARRKITYIGLIVSFFAAVILSVPVAVLFIYSKVEDKGKPKEDAFARLKHEMRRDGRDQVWPAGTITSLERWVELEGGQYRDEMRLEFSNNIALKIDSNKLETDDTDFIFIEKLAQRPHALDSYSDYLLASAIAYVHLKHSGFDDIDHPERFRRAPGHNPSANSTDYTTYVKVLMVRCTQQPTLSGCRETFTEADILRFETMPNDTNSLNWLERKNLLPPLRAALGYPVPNP